MNLFRSTLRSFARNLLVPMLIEYSWSIVRKRIPGLQNLLKTRGEADARFMHRARSFRMYSWRAAVFPLQSSVNFKKRAAAYIGNGVETRASRMASLNTKFYFIFFFLLPLFPSLSRSRSIVSHRCFSFASIPLMFRSPLIIKFPRNYGETQEQSALQSAMIVRLWPIQTLFIRGRTQYRFDQSFKISRFHKLSLFFFSLSLSRVKNRFIRGWENAKRGRREKTKKIEAEGNIAEGTL